MPGAGDGKRMSRDPLTLAHKDKAFADQLTAAMRVDGHDIVRVDGQGLVVPPLQASEGEVYHASIKDGPDSDRFFHNRRADQQPFDTGLFWRPGESILEARPVLGTHGSAGNARRRVGGNLTLIENRSPWRRPGGYRWRSSCPRWPTLHRTNRPSGVRG